MSDARLRAALLELYGHPDLTVNLNRIVIRALEERHGQDQEAEGPKAAAQEHAVAGKEAQEKGQEVIDDIFAIKKVRRERAPFLDRPDRFTTSGYDAHEDAEAIKLWLWYR